MDEFELIRRHFQPLSRPVPGVELGIGDDCALLSVPPGQLLALSVDTLVAGVHFLPDIDPAQLAWRALATSASDLAAMGASPLAFTLALTLPQADSGWLKAFSAGLAEASSVMGLTLMGGDTTRGPLTLSLQVHGYVPQGQALCRRGAAVGDLVCVSGSLGDAAAALRWLACEAGGSDVAFLKARYYRPTPRFALGQALRGQATACVDVSDGLLADLGHILEASSVGAVLDLASLPLSPALLKTESLAVARDLALGGGDDYELCFTLPEHQLASLLSEERGVPVAVIGEICAEPGLYLREEGQLRAVSVRGYRHFRSN